MPSAADPAASGAAARAPAAPGGASPGGADPPDRRIESGDGDAPGGADDPGAAPGGTRFIFVTGGVVSSLGKGLTAAALGALLQARGFSVRLRKLDPYLNIDPGTMNPFEHGEVFVTDDGAETDLDLGHYERFTGAPARRSDSLTTGIIYGEILARERRGDYLGATVQVVPHVTDAIQRRIEDDLGGVDFCICEIGGTVGDIESLPFLEAARQFGNRRPGRALFVHATLVPRLGGEGGELKTKPTQHSVRELQASGIRAGMLVVRSGAALGAAERRKLALFCNLPDEAIIEALDAEVIYDLPAMLHGQGMDALVLRSFGVASRREPDLRPWRDFCRAVRSPEGEVRVGVVGKYSGLRDAYLSLLEALVHGGVANGARVAVEWLAAEDVARDPARLNGVDGVLVPGGFGERGVEGKMAAARFARRRGVPFLGICLGMQLALVDAARELPGMEGAGSAEFGPCDPEVVGLLTEWRRGDGGVERRARGGDLGGTMRLGSHPAVLAPGSLVSRAYGGAERVDERHRHRFEVNPALRGPLAAAGLEFSGMSPDGALPEAVELRGHPWFVGVQFHPELKSRPFAPHPLFAGFVGAALERSRLV